MASSSLTNPAYNVPSFNGRDRLVRLHQEITDFLHYHSHVRYAATASLPPHTTTANQRERENYGELPRSDNPMDLLFLKHLHPLTIIMPDHSHVTELLNETHSQTQDLTFLIDQAHALCVQMKLATDWTTRLYQKGAGPVNFNTEQAS